MCVCVHMCANVCVFMYVCGVCVHGWGTYIPQHTCGGQRTISNVNHRLPCYLKHGLLFCYCFIDQASWPDHFQRFSYVWSSSHHRSTGITGMLCIYIIFISIPVSNALWGFDLRATHFRIKCFDHWAISQLQMIFISCIEYCAFFDGNSLPWVYPFQHSILRWVSMARSNRR